ncbi:unnamed protein product [marine sediment metagenome]|uniref:TNase-like domain-containing protein n=1 Tax=marine sediment metagenome TaxID=412755 RepID=X1I7W9_9ZZZZ
MGEVKKREKYLDSAKPTEALRMMIEGQEVRIETVSRDEYARAVSRVHQEPE